MARYQKAPLVLARLENNTGQAAFLEFGQDYSNSPDKITPGLLKVLEKVADPEQTALFESMPGE